VPPLQGLTLLFGSLYGGGGSNGSATGSSVVSAVGSTAGGAVTADASASGSSTVAAAFSALATFSAFASGSSVVSAAGSAASTAATTASATGSSAVSATTSARATATANAVGFSTVAATTVPTAAKAPSVEQKFARWASYQRIGSSYIRQVSPGVYLRVRPEETVPQIVAQERDIGRLDEVSLRGNAIALGLTKEDQRKLRKELRKIKAEEARVVRICGTVATSKGFARASAGSGKAHKVAASGSARCAARMSATAAMTARATNGGMEGSFSMRYHGLSERELIDILEQLEII